MAIQKQRVVDLVEVTEHGVVQVRESVRITEDGTVIAQSFERHVVNPGDDYSKEDARVQAICAATHTQETIDAYKASIAPKEI